MAEMNKEEKDQVMHLIRLILNQEEDAISILSKTITTNPSLCDHMIKGIFYRRDGDYGEDGYGFVFLERYAFGERFFFFGLDGEGGERLELGEEEVLDATFEGTDDGEYQGTLLHWASIYDRPTAISCLLSHGADPLIKFIGSGPHNGKIAEDLAIVFNSRTKAVTQFKLFRGEKREREKQVREKQEWEKQSRETEKAQLIQLQLENQLLKEGLGLVKPVVDQTQPVQNWTVDQVRTWFQAISLTEHCATIIKEKIDGVVLPTLTLEDWKELGVKAFGDVKKLKNGLAQLGIPL